MSLDETHTLATELRDFPEWHRGIRHYAVWCLPVEDPSWLAFISKAQRLLSPRLHAGYERQPHITLFAAGLVDKNHYSAAMQAAQIQSLELYSLSPVLLTPSVLSTFSTAPWLGVEDGDNQLQRLRNRLAETYGEDSPASRYQPHITLGFYRENEPVSTILQQLQPLQEQALALPPLRIDRLQLCYYDTHRIQGRLVVKKSIELDKNAAVDNPPQDPLEAIRQMRRDQLKVCALKQKSELDQLVAAAKRTEVQQD